MPRLLVTGGAGFVGANFVHYWLREHPGDRVVVLDALTYAGNLANLAPVRHRPELRVVHGDIRNQALVTELLRQEALDTVVHFAAESHVDRSISGPDAFIDTNVHGTHCLLKAARHVWLSGESVVRHRFHHVSTDEVFGALGPTDPPFTETSRYAPNSPYAASKAAADHLVRAYHRTYGLAATISHCPNNYGAYQFPEKLIPLSIVHLLNGGTVPLYGDGLQIRDWLSVEDHCRGIERVLMAGRPGEAYNIGGNQELTNRAVVGRLCECLDRAFAEEPGLARLYPHAPPARHERCEQRIRFVTDRPGHDRRYAVATDKAVRELGFIPREDFANGLRRTLGWYLDNEVWWRSVMDGSYRAWLSQQYAVPD